jgi:hypothetical protein
MRQASAFKLDPDPQRKQCRICNTIVNQTNRTYFFGLLPRTVWYRYLISEQDKLNVNYDVTCELVLISQAVLPAVRSRHHRSQAHQNR